MLQEEAHEQVHIVRVAVDVGQLLAGSWGQLGLKIRETVCPAEATFLPVVVVAGQSVVPATLDVDGNQVQHSVEQVICHLKIVFEKIFLFIRYLI